MRSQRRQVKSFCGVLEAVNLFYGGRECEESASQNLSHNSQRVKQQYILDLSLSKYVQMCIFSGQYGNITKTSDFERM